MTYVVIIQKLYIIAVLSCNSNGPTDVDVVRRHVEPIHDNRLTVQEELPNWNTRVRRQTIEKLSGKCGAAKSDVTILVNAIKDPKENLDVRIDAAVALWTIDQDSRAIRFLIDTFAADKLNLSVQASILYSVGGFGAEAVPFLTEAIRSNDPYIRYCGVCALGEIALRSQEAVPGLIEALDSSDNSVRHAALRALGEIGPAGRLAEPRLIELLSDSDIHIRAPAVLALMQIDPHSLQARRVLLDSLQDVVLKDDQDSLHVWFGVLGRLGNKIQLLGPTLTPLLVSVFGDPLNYSDDRIIAASCLGDIGPAALAAVPVLRTSARSFREWANVRRAAVDALKKIEPEKSAIDTPNSIKYEKR